MLRASPWLVDDGSSHVAVRSRGRREVRATQEQFRSLGAEQLELVRAMRTIVLFWGQCTQLATESWWWSIVKGHSNKPGCVANGCMTDTNCCKVTSLTFQPERFSLF